MTLNAIGLFCEDIREEKSGQVTLIGILPDNVNVPPAPDNAKAILPKLGLYVRVHLGMDDEPGPMTIKLVFPDDSELMLGNFEPNLIATAKRQAQERRLPIAGLVSHAVLSGLQASVPARIMAILESAGERRTLAVLNFLAVLDSAPDKEPAEPPPPAM